MDGSEFVRSVFERFPEIRQPLADWLDWGAIPDSDERLTVLLKRSIEADGPTFALYHTVSVFKDITQNAINVGDREPVRCYFIFVDQALASGDDDVVNAIAVSYLEVLNFTDQKKQRSWAVAELPPRSLAVARDLQGDLLPS